MPELPEVETIVRGLASRVKGKKIKDTELRYENLLRDCQGKVLKAQARDSFLKVIKDKTITDVTRRGKYILLHLEEITILVHLRMTGKFSSDKEILSDKHTHLIFFFRDGDFLAYNDVRKFGTFQTALCTQDLMETTMSRLGPEPLGEDFTLEYLQEELSNSKKNIKAFLLTQEKIAGIGNIYADEVLFFAGVAPKRPADSLTGEEIKKIHQGVIEKLQMGIDSGGASIRNYVNEAGEKGNFQNLIKVYGRRGEKCQECQTPLLTETVAGRTSTWCPQCQKDEIKMKVIGLTGGIASGKTTITNYLQSKGIPVIDGDRVSREVVMPGSEGLLKIKEVFGEKFISPDGSLDRKKLGNLVFGNPEMLKKLNQTIHPIIRKDFVKKINNYKKNPDIRLVVLDAALLIESEMTDLTDSLWLVYADKDVQVQRVMARDGISEENALAVINSQMSLSEKKKYADEVIDNNSTVEKVYRKVDRLLKKYS